MKNLNNALKSFWNNEDGLEMVEYAVIAALIIVAASAAFTTLATGITTELAAVTKFL
jgi:Flp pilus assembly pilin Flp